MSSQDNVDVAGDEDGFEGEPQGTRAARDSGRRYTADDGRNRSSTRCLMPPAPGAAIRVAPDRVTGCRARKSERRLTRPAARRSDSRNVVAPPVHVELAVIDLARRIVIADGGMKHYAGVQQRAIRAFELDLVVVRRARAVNVVAKHQHERERKPARQATICSATSCCHRSPRPESPITANRTEPSRAGSASAPGAGVSSRTIVVVARRTLGSSAGPAAARGQTEDEQGEQDQRGQQNEHARRSSGNPAERHELHFDLTAFRGDGDFLETRLVKPRAERFDVGCNLLLELGDGFPTDAALSAARLTSDVSFIIRPMPRAAVVARPSVPTVIDLRPNRVPSTVAPTDTAVCSFWSDTCCCSFSTAASARRRRSPRAACLAAYFLRIASIAASRAACSSSCNRARNRARLSGVRGDAERQLAKQLTRWFAVSHRANDFSHAGYFLGSAVTAGSGANRASAEPGSRRRSAAVTSSGFASTQSTSMAASVTGTAQQVRGGIDAQRTIRNDARRQGWRGDTSPDQLRRVGAHRERKNS